MRPVLAATMWRAKSKATLTFQLNLDLSEGAERYLYSVRPQIKEFGQNKKLFLHLCQLESLPLIAFMLKFHRFLPSSNRSIKRRAMQDIFISSILRGHKITASADRIAQSFC